VNAVNKTGCKLGWEFTGWTDEKKVIRKGLIDTTAGAMLLLEKHEATKLNDCILVAYISVLAVRGGTNVKNIKICS
jgi:hypothetical protein